MRRACRILLILTLLILTFSAVSRAGPPAPDVGTAEKTRFDYALGLYMSGAYDIAVHEFQGFLKDYPDGEYADDAYYWMGKYFMMEGSFDEGLNQFKTVITSLPSGDKAPDAQYEVAGYWSDPANPKHDYKNALAEYLKIGFFYPDSPLADKAKYYAAHCQFRLRDYKKAVEDLKAFIEKYPGSELAAPAAYELGMADILDGRTDDALAAFQSVRDKYPAGLYRQRALDAIELVLRFKGHRPLGTLFVYGGKGDAPGMLSRPTDAALDPEGGLYISDTGNGRVQRFKVEAKGLTLDSPGITLPSLEKDLQPVRPAGLATGRKGLVYLTDSYMHRVQAFLPDGRLALSFGGRGREAGELDSPQGIAVDEGGNIYVADRGNRRVDKFDDKGHFIKAIGNSGPSPDNMLVSPAGVALDPEGNLIVTDSSAGRVCKYNPDGNLTMVFGGETGGRYRLSSPAGVGVDGLGNVYVVDRGRPSVLVLDRDLTPVEEFPVGDKKLLDNPDGIAVSEGGELFIVDPGLNQVVVVR